MRHTSTAPPDAVFPGTPPVRAVATVGELFPGVAENLQAARSFDGAGEHTDPLTAGTQLDYAGPGYGYWLKLGTGGMLDYALP